MEYIIKSDSRRLLDLKIQELFNGIDKENITYFDLSIDNLSDIARINPYRYKGYYYDQETNLYYCRTR